MSSAPRWLTVFGLTAATAIVCADPAQAQTILCKPITSVPFEITTSGVYCADSALRFTSDPAGVSAAIYVKADHVVVDLNGFTLEGPVDPTTPPPGAPAIGVGIYAKNQSHVTVRNGTVRTFRRGVFIEGSVPLSPNDQGHVVEGLNVAGASHEGIAVEGTGSIVRKNRVLGTAGAAVEAHGIRVKGLRPQVLDNEVTSTYGGGGAAGHGIHVDASGAVVEGNRVGNSDQPSSASVGILVRGPDAQVVGNRLALLGEGILFELPPGTGKYRDNLTTGVGTPYTGGTDAGNNQ